MSEQLTENLDNKFEQLMSKIQFDPEKATLEDNKKEEEDFRKSYKLEDGDTFFRIIPFDDGSVIMKTDVHMNLGAPFLCPNKLDRSVECPECKLGWDIYNNNGKKHTDDSKNYLSQEKWFIRGIVRAKEKEDIEKYGHPVIRFIDFTPTVGKVIASYFTKAEVEEWGNICDFTLGRDLKIKKDGEKAKLRQASLSIERAPSQKPLFTGVKVGTPEFKNYFVQMFEKALNPNDRFASKTPLEILDLLDRHLAKLKKTNTSKTDDVETSSKFEDESADFKQKMKSLEGDFEKVLESL
jgi:hypothetical protein